MFFWMICARPRFGDELSRVFPRFSECSLQGRKYGSVDRWWLRMVFRVVGKIGGTR